MRYSDIVVNAWQHDFFDLCEQAAQDAEQFLEILADNIEETAVEVEQILTDLMDPITDVVVEFDVAVSEATQPFHQTIDPIIQAHPACMGCQHYHGQFHGGNLLVCAMHPYGVDEKSCPDWDSVWPAQP